MIKSVFIGIVMFLIVLLSGKLKLLFLRYSGNAEEKLPLMHFLLGLPYGLLWNFGKSSFLIGYFICVTLIVLLIFKVIFSDKESTHHKTLISAGVSFITGSLLGLVF
jgi:hypothetical protein